MNKDKKYWERYTKYLCQLSLLNQVKNADLLNGQEYIKYKKRLISEYKIQDFV